MTAPYSFSKISAYRTCPVQWAARYFYKSVKFEQTIHTIWGNEVHSCAEAYIKEGKQPTPRFDLLKPYLNVIDKMEGDKGAEVELAVTKDLKPTGFWSDDAWLRGKIDFRCLQGDRAIQWDWKTGKKKNDFEEMRCFSLMTFLNEPEVEKTKNVYVWLKDGDTPTSEILERKQIDELLDPLVSTIEQIEHSVCYEDFKPRPSGLCGGGWCPVTTCKFNKGKK